MTYRAVNSGSKMSAKANTIHLLEAIAIKRSTKATALCMLSRRDGGEQQVFKTAQGRRLLHVANQILDNANKELDHAYHQKKRYEQSFGKIRRLNRHDNGRVEAAVKDLGIKGFKFSHAVDFVEDDDQDNRRPRVEGSHGITVVLRENARQVSIVPSGPHAADIEEGK